MVEKLIKVYRAAGEAEASIIQGLLESHGIKSILRSNAAPSIHVFTVDGMGEYQVMVKESQAIKARSLIRGSKSV